MKQRMTIVLLVVAAVVFGYGAWYFRNIDATPTTQQSSCDVTTIEARVDDADLILTGTVFAVIPEDTTGASILITPQTVYKGTITPDNAPVIAARAATENESGIPTADSDLHFTSSDPVWLLFLTKRVDGRFDTSTCAGSRVLGDGLTEPERELLDAWLRPSN